MRNMPPIQHEQPGGVGTSQSCANETPPAPRLFVVGARGRPTQNALRRADHHRPSP